jgi:hypothetical protein
MGLCPCPRCLTPKSLFKFLGLSRDMRCRVANLREYVMTKVVKARAFIYTNGNTVDGVKVEHTLGEGSWVPTLASVITFIPFSYRLTQSACRISSPKNLGHSASTHSACS